MFEDVLGAILAGNGIGVALWVWLNAKFKALEEPIKKLGELASQVTQLDKDVAVMRRDMDSMANGSKRATARAPVVVVGVPTSIEGAPRG